MPFPILPTLLFICALVGIIIMVVRRLPEVLGDGTDNLFLDQGIKQLPAEPVVEKLKSQGLPMVAANKSKQLATLVVKKAWKFMLEAKGVTHSPSINHRLKRMLRPNKEAQELDIAPVSLSYEGREQELLERIKRRPKDLQLYAVLAKFYADNDNLEEAATLYEYLSKHDKGNTEYLTHSGLLNYRLKQYQKSASQLSEAVGLDSSDPNRYYYLGLALQHIGQIKEAREAFVLAQKLEPENPLYEQALNQGLLK